jgi:hypothetical protein
MLTFAEPPSRRMMCAARGWRMTATDEKCGLTRTGRLAAPVSSVFSMRTVAATSDELREGF